MSTRIPDITEQVFEGRHRAYGAYALRKAAQRFTGLGFLLAVCLITVGFIAPWSWYRWQQRQVNAEQKPVEQKKVVSYSELAAPPPIDLIPPPPTQPVVTKTKASVKFLPPVAKPDAEVPDDLEALPTMDDLAKIDPGVNTVEGDSLIYDPSEVVIEEVAAEEAPPEVKPAKVYTFAERLPSFPGGAQALTQFLSEHIEYPLMAQENMLEGSVVAQFVVETDGRISRIQIVRGLGGGCDQEVIRVIKQMPLWEPGLQNQTPVPVRFTLPVRFQLED